MRHFSSCFFFSFSFFVICYIFMRGICKFSGNKQVNFGCYTNKFKQLFLIKNETHRFCNQKLYNTTILWFINHTFHVRTQITFHCRSSFVYKSDISYVVIVLTYISVSFHPTYILHRKYVYTNIFDPDINKVIFIIYMKTLSCICYTLW